jgi:uncharacterized lipoprotein YddW (UPF0748 family)
MKKCLLFLLSIICCSVSVYAQQAPKREVRGTWIATYANIDWPKNRTEPVPLQRAALISILDHHQATGINTIYFQIRSQCDAMYASDIEPWSADLTGTQGKAPVELSLMDPASTKVWDPLKFMIDECHRRGMELHAWMNPYRAINNYNGINAFAPNHVARQHPEWLLSQGTLRILDPGIRAAQAYIKRVVADVATRYDLDGIHFDDYFYPPQAAAGVTPYNDDATFNADPRGFTDRGDWRRDNVNRFIKAVSDTLKQVKPWVKFGISPSGIYRNSTNPAIGSATSGLQHYVTLFADTRKWLQEGWIDYLAPQVYWYIGQPGANYAVIVPWWNNNAYGRHIYIGMAGYKVNDAVQGGPNWAVPNVIPNEVRINRSAANPNIYGHAIYNTSSLLSTTKLGFEDSLRLKFYKYPALIPRMPWRDNEAPEPATALTGIRHGADSVILDWTAPTYVANEFDQVKRFVIYRSESPVIDLTDPANIVAIVPAAATHYEDTQLPKDTTYYYTITSLDRFHNESIPSNVTDYLPPVIACAPNQALDVDLTCKVTIPDYTGLASVSDDVSNASTLTVVQSPAPGTIISGPGITVVTLTATDASGKSSSCNFSVISTDHLAPVIVSAPDDILVRTGEHGADCSVSVNWIEPTATDNCNTSLPYFKRTHAPGDAFTVGTTKVTYVFKDESGNADSTSFNVVVNDDTKPVMITRNITRTLVGGTVSITADEVNNGSWDNCGISSLTVSTAAFNCTNIGENTVTLTAIDVHGNKNTSTAIVTVIGNKPQPFVDISRQNTTFTGLPDNTIALGYGAQALTLSVISPGDPFGSYYSWSPATGLSNTSSSSVVFTASAEGTYTFTVQVVNKYGCAAAAQVTVRVIDARCGNKDNKVLLCRAIGHHSVELCVARQAVFVLLKTGAKLGSCDANESLSQDDVAETSVLTAYPNPFEQHVNIQFKLPVADRHVRLDIFNMYGGKVMSIFEGATESGQVQNFSLSTNELQGGVFLVRLIASSGQSYYVKIVHQE